MTKLKITAIGQAKLAPDQMEIFIQINNLYNSYQGALNASTIAYEEFVKAFEKADFDKTQLFLESYGIEERYEYLNDKRQFMGYEYLYQLRHTMDLDLPRYQELLKICSHLDSKPTLNVSYTLKDRKALQVLAIDDAIEKGYQQAHHIATTLNSQGLKLLAIDLRNEPDQMYRSRNMMLEKAALSDVAIRPIEEVITLAMDFEFEEAQYKLKP